VSETEPDIEPQPGEESLGELFGRLIDDAKGFGRAELDYYRVLARERLRAAKTSLWMGAVAGALALAAAVALVVGSVLTLTPMVGPGWATLIVVGIALLLSGVMGWLAWQQIKRVMGDLP
jgi:predicted phage tail protein